MSVRAPLELTAPTEKRGRGAPPIVCPGHTRPLAEITFSELTPDGRFLISACLDGSPMLRDATSGDWIGTFSGHKGAVWSAKLCSEARLAATGSGDFSAKLWDAITGACVATLDHKHIVKSVDFSGDRCRLATAGHEGLVRIFDVERHAAAVEPAVECGGDVAVVTSMAATGAAAVARKPVNKVLWAAGGLVVAGGADGVVRVWDPRSSAVAASVDVGAEVRDMELSDGALGPTLTVAAGDSVHFLDAAKWGELRRGALAAPVHFREEGGAALRQLPGGQSRVLLGGGRHGGSRQGALGVEKGATRVGDIGSDLTVFVVDYVSGTVVEERKGHCGPVRSVRFHPDSQKFATGSEDGTIRLWDMASD
ncbi:WD40-repeat-containing domain protein [Pelagophyceae sp. CCMP2097]|nr:WD40-repeat-containing domain protein [Pelagophyceae sp. CCMP2097]